ncbi:MAG: hypothetical protein IT381_02260 [Deltaproteobacteria bacterium]|nr:hypothetical protein [Deltaproteobacteria bacterium]
MSTAQKAQNDRVLRLAWQSRERSPRGAREMVARVVSTEPRRADAWHALALLDLAENEHKYAVFALRQALALEPDNLDIRVAYAELLIDLLDYKGALAELKLCCQRDPQMRHPSGVRARVVIVRMQKEIKRRLQS